MKVKHALLLDIAIIIGIVWSLIAFNNSRFPDKVNMKLDTVMTTDTVLVHDTIMDTVPEPVDRLVLKYVSVPIKNISSDTAQNHIRDKPDTLSFIDSSHVALPITQNIYKGEAYKAWVSGYRAQLDSIHIYNTTTQILKSEKITRQRHKRWGLGIQLGGGFIRDKPQLYVGAGIQYNIFSW